MWREFVELAEKGEDPFTTLCARFGVSRKTGYKWLNRYRVDGEAGLRHQSRRPKTSPRRTPDAVVEAVLAVRLAHPDWSTARLREELDARTVAPLPAVSTIDLILRRHRDSLALQPSSAEAEKRRRDPSFRWILQQGCEVTLADGTRAAAVMMRDDVTGFIVGATLLSRRREETLETFTDKLLRQHGLPWRVLLPRGVELGGQPASRSHTPLTIRLMRLGITVEFSFRAPSGPPPPEAAEQAQLAALLSKLPSYQSAPLLERAPAADPLEQFARSAGRLTAGAAAVRLEELRERHNFGGKPAVGHSRSPLTAFRPSPRPLPDELPSPVANPATDLRLVSEKGILTFRRRLVHVGRIFAAHQMELRPTPFPSRYKVFFCGQELGLVDLAMAPIDGTTSLQLSRA